MNHRYGKKGQAVLLVVVAMGIFLIGALGLAIDVSQLFGQQQMAQVAADAAAQAAMLSIFQGVNDPTKAGSATNFPITGFKCTDYPNSTPCRYARMNGFGNGDTVAVSFPTCPFGGSICASTTPNEVQVTITRSVSNGLIRMVGGSAFTSIGATAIAATLDVSLIHISEPTRRTPISYAVF